MSKLFIPENYKSPRDVYKTQQAISFIKRTFQDRLADALNLKRVSAPLFVTENQNFASRLEVKQFSGFLGNHELSLFSNFYDPCVFAV